MRYFKRVLIIAVTISTLLNYNKCYCQLSNSLVKTICKQAFKTIDLSKIESKFDDSLTFEDFDFSEFKPVHNLKENGTYYKAFYKNNELLKLSRRSKLDSLIFEFYFWNFEKYKIYIVSTYYKEIPDLLLNNITGFFIYDKSLKSNKFFGIETSHFIEVNDTTNTRRQASLLGSLKPNTNLIKTVISLDKSLCPKNRLNFYNNRLVSHSVFCLEENIFFERLSVYDNPKINISKITLKKLSYLLYNEPFEKVSFKIAVILNQNCQQVIWADPLWGYIYTPWQMY